MKKLKIVGISGSLRQSSFNTGLLRAAVTLCPSEADIEILQIDKLKLFNQDLETNLPEDVKIFKNSVKTADAVIFATPEYNYSVPGVLKNAIDWLSRPYGNNSLDGKPAAIISASGGMLGGNRAQYHLRQIFVFLNVYPLNKPEVIVPFALEKFDGKGVLIDQKTKDKIKELIVALIDWTRKLKE